MGSASDLSSFARALFLSNAFRRLDARLLSRSFARENQRLRDSERSGDLATLRLGDDFTSQLSNNSAQSLVRPSNIALHELR